ncbi:MAG: thioredoxin [Aigarchaeota archaeon]|nr:thioredoxin [Aigarchaeota archaeon]
MSEKATDIVVGNDENFDNLISKDMPILVDFWAEWCAPCKFMEPLFQELAGSFFGRVVFVRVNVDENPATASKYGVRAIPTFVVFKDGNEVKRIVGAVGKEPLEAALREVLE